MTPAVPNPTFERTDSSGSVGRGAASATTSSSALKQTAEDPRIKEAATQFEAVLLRQMLSSLEKTTNSSTGSKSTGGSIYGSMVVNTVADAIANAGGLGLASLLTKSLQTVASGAGSMSKPPALGSDLTPKSKLLLNAAQPLSVNGGHPPVASGLREGQSKWR